MPYGSSPTGSFLTTRPAPASKKTTASSRKAVATASGPLPTQVTPSGWSPTAISCSTFRASVSTTLTVPLSGLATSRRLPSGETSRRLLEELAGAAAGRQRRTTAVRRAAWRRDIGVPPVAGMRSGDERCHYGRGGEERQRGGAGDKGRK